MSARRAVWEVARREIVERSRSRVLQVSLAVLLIIAVGGAVAAARLRGHTPTDKIGLVGSRSVALKPAIQLEAQNSGRRVRLYQLSTLDGRRATGEKRNDRRRAGRRKPDLGQELANLGARARGAKRSRGPGRGRSAACLRPQPGAGAERAVAASGAGRRAPTEHAQHRWQPELSHVWPARPVRPADVLRPGGSPGRYRGEVLTRG